MADRRFSRMAALLLKAASDKNNRLSNFHRKEIEEQVSSRIAEHLLQTDDLPLALILEFRRWRPHILFDQAEFVTWFLGQDGPWNQRHSSLSDADLLELQSKIQGDFDVQEVMGEFDG